MSRVAVAGLALLVVAGPAPAQGLPSSLFNKTAVAVKDLGRVVAMKDQTPAAVPDSVMPAVYLNFGRALKKNGQLGEARAAWEKGKTLYPAAPETPAIETELRSL